MGTRSRNPGGIESKVAEIHQLATRGFLGLARMQAEDLAREFPRGILPLQALAKIAEMQSDFVPAARYYERVAALDPRNPDHLIEATSSWSQAGMMDESLATLSRSLQLAPNKLAVLISNAMTNERYNNDDIALEAVKTARSQNNRAFALDFCEAKIHLKRKEFDEAEAALKAMLDRGHGYPTSAISAVQFDLVKLYDRTGRYDDAWAQAQEIYGECGPLTDINRYLNTLAEARAFFSPRNLKMWRRPTTRTELPIFIIGMPRSGTSLVEQILGMHSGVSQAGEAAVIDFLGNRVQTVCDSYHNYPKCLIDMLPETADQLQQLYLESVEPYRDGAIRVSNKNLMNYDYLGLSSVILPGSQAIHVKRHPLDNCLSCHLTDLVRSGHHYVAKLEDLAQVYRGRQEVWMHWQEVLDMPMLVVPYENLTLDQETWTRRLIDHVGLPWEDDCLEFHRSKRKAMTISYDQVNKKMYRTSVERWRNYEKHLGPLIDVLGDEIDHHEALVAAAAAKS